MIQKLLTNETPQYLTVDAATGTAS